VLGQTVQRWRRRSEHHAAASPRSAELIPDQVSVSLRPSVS
jgi:hypothetical protein